DHHGVSPLSRRGYAHRADIQHLRAAHAAKRWARIAEFCVSGIKRKADYRIRQRKADPELLLRVRPDRRNLQTGDVGRTSADERRKSAGNYDSGVCGEGPKAF